jgi:outer membrane protein assembly factor BamE (lipoprotein component of BamABCDE complex)
MKEGYYNPNTDEKLTVAKAQKEVKKGMSSASVVEVMGSPNIISTDENKCEVWVYDKISTQFAKQNISATVGGLFIAGAGAGYGAASGDNQTSASSQRTLTVIIKFDTENKVRDVAYHTSSF